MSNWSSFSRFSSTSLVIFSIFVGLFKVLNSNYFSYEFLASSCSFMLFLLSFFSFSIYSKFVLFRFLGTALTSTFTGILMGSGIFFGLGAVRLKGFATVYFFFSYTSFSLNSSLLKVFSKLWTNSDFLPVALSERVPSISVICGTLSSS